MQTRGLPRSSLAAREALLVSPGSNSSTRSRRLAEPAEYSRAANESQPHVAQDWQLESKMYEIQRSIANGIAIDGSLRHNTKRPASHVFLRDLSLPHPSSDQSGTS